MSSCNIDHSLEDVEKKLLDQRSFLPNELYNGAQQLLKKSPNQETLNELFHLLKKYDLASEEERSKRNESIQRLIS